MIKCSCRALRLVINSRGVQLEALVAGVDGDADGTNVLNSKGKLRLRSSRNIFE